MVKLKTTEASRYLGIDYGEAKIGLALADSETKIAFAYKTLRNDKNLLQNLVKIIKEKEIKKIIIGKPFYASNKKAEHKEIELAKLIKEILPPVNIEYQNEMFTTKMAQEKLKEKGIKNIKNLDDQEAARIILQDWLDSCYNEVNKIIVKNVN